MSDGLWSVHDRFIIKIEHIFKKKYILQRFLVKMKLVPNVVYVHTNATTLIWLLRAQNYAKEMQRETEELRIESWWTKERATKSPIFKIDIACERNKSFLLRKKGRKKTEKDEIEQEMHFLLTLGLGFRFPVYTRYASQLTHQSLFRIGF